MSEQTTDQGSTGSGKWGVAARAGFQPVPDTLLVKQKELGLDTTDLIVLLNLTSFWWFRDRPPFVRTNIIAKRMGVSPRTVQRSIKKMEERNYIRRDDWLLPDGSFVPAVVLDGLVDKLEELARDDVVLSARIERSEQGFQEGDEIPF